MSATIPAWLFRRLPHLKKSGKLSIPTDFPVSLADLSLPSVAPLLTVCRSLDLSGVRVASLAGLPPLPRLVVFIADRSQLSSFENFSRLRSATSISLRETPLSRKPTFRLSVLLAVGPRALTSLDGAQIGDRLRDRAAAFPSVCGALVNAGWVATAAPPDAAALRALCAEYSVADEGVIAPAPEEEEEEAAEEKVLPPFEELLAQLQRDHETVVQRGAALFNLTD
jgi:hypothetical protein